MKIILIIINVIIMDAKQFSTVQLLIVLYFFYKTSIANI